MDKNSSANSQNSSMRPDNPFANLPNDDSANEQSVAGSDSQLEELRRRVDDSAYANSAYDRENAFSVTNTQERSNIGVGGSATSFGDIKDAELEFLSKPVEEEPVLTAPEPELPTFEPAPEEPIKKEEPQPAPRPAVEEVPEAASRQEQHVLVQESQPLSPPMPAPAPAPTPFQEATKKEKGGLSMPIIVAIIVVGVALVALGIWAVVSLSKRDKGGVDVKSDPEPVAAEETVSLEEYNRRVDAKEEVNCTATYARAKHSGSDYAAGEYEIYSEKAWTIAADAGWEHVYVTNYDFRFNMKSDSVLASKIERTAPASIYFDDQDAYLWSVTLTPRAAGDGSANYRLAQYESIAPSFKMVRGDVEASFEKDFYETIKVSSEEFNDDETGSVNFVCKQGGLSDYQEFIDARKAEIGAGDAK